MVVWTVRFAVEKQQRAKEGGERAHLAVVIKGGIRDNLQVLRTSSRERPKGTASL